MTKEELDIQIELEKYFTESTGFGRDKIRNFMDIVNKALKQKGEQIAELERELTVEKDQHQEEINLHLHAEEYIKSLEQKLEQTEKDLADYQFNYPKIKELEKENAELTETLKTYNGCGDWDNDFHTCRVYLQHEELQMYIEQLTKATELLELFIQWNYGCCKEPDYKDIVKQAEQFLEK